MGLFFAKLIGRLPLQVLFYTVAPVLKFLAFRVARYRVKVARANLKIAFPRKTDQEREVILGDYYSYLADLICEILHAGSMGRKEFGVRCEFKNKDAIYKPWSEGKSVILMALHQGNWEWMLNSVATTIDLPMEVIYKPLHNEGFDKYIHETRTKFGAKMVAHKRAVPHFMRKKEQYFLVLLSDQAPLRNRKKVWSTMFGVDTAFPLGADFFAKRSNAVVVYAQPKRIKRGVYEVEVTTMIEPPYAGSENEVIDAYAKKAEAAISIQPETWLWSNRRWRYTKAEDPTLSK